MIPHNRPTLGKEEEDAAVRVLRGGWLAQGEEVLKMNFVITLDCLMVMQLHYPVVHHHYF